VWSPDSQRIAYAENANRLSYEEDIVEIDVTKKQIRRLTTRREDFNLTLPSWSPDGPSFTYSTYQDDQVWIAQSNGRGIGS
jgi:Tol biopolymer transport system component